MLKRTLAVALAAITVVYTVVPAEAHRRHFNRHHGHHGFYGGGGFGFGFGFGPKIIKRGYYAPRGYYRYRRIPAAAVDKAAPQVAPAVPIETTPAPVAVAPAAPIVESVPAAPIQSAPVPITTVPPSNQSYENIGSYDAYTSQSQTAPAPIQSLPTETFAAPTVAPEVFQVVPADTFTTAPSFSAPQPLELESIQTVPIFQ